RDFRHPLRRPRRQAALKGARGTLTRHADLTQHLRKSRSPPEYFPRAATAMSGCMGRFAWEVQTMQDLYFHCSDATHDLIDRHGIAVHNLSEAFAHADNLVRSMLMKPNAEDWRG